MLSYIPRCRAALVIPVILASVAAAGCSREPEPSSRLETASTPSTNVDTAPARIDTVPARSPMESATSAAPPAAKPVRRQAVAPATPSAAPISSGAQDQYLKYDAGTNTVTFELIGGPLGFQFNGYASGGATLTLPPKANVVMNFVNKDGTPHSAVVIAGDGPLPNAEGEPAIPRAYTNQLIQGLAQEASDVMRFQVPESGSYRIFCGVPGHGLGGMWIWMKVDPAAKAPSFGPTKS
jgi:Sulfocyanin (SoxE) domain